MKGNSFRQFRNKVGVALLPALLLSWLATEVAYAGNVIERGGELYQQVPFSDTYVPLFLNPGDYPEEDHDMLVELYKMYRDVTGSNTVYDVPAGMSCGLAVDNIGTYIDKLCLPGTGWQRLRVDSVDPLNALGGTAHTVTLFKSPTGHYYLFDSYTGSVDIAAAFKDPYENVYQVVEGDRHNLTLGGVIMAAGNPNLRFKPGAGKCFSDECGAPAKAKSKSRVTAGGAYDPNDKSGPPGAGAAHHVNPDAWLTYAIRFENVSTATLPAQRVVISDVLDAALDLGTLELGGVGFNLVSVSVPPGLAHFSGEAQVASDPNPVRVHVELDAATRTLVWVIESVDPLTGDLPEDPLAGFLPPNDDQGRGEGFVTFRARPLAGLASGTAIHNQARIVFDVNAPIDTDTTVNTIDANPSTSSVAPLPALSPPAFPVMWAGSDGAGSGVAFYDLFVSVDAGTFLPWQIATASTQAIFTGTVGHTYSFYSVATDNVGTRQPTPAGAQSSTTVSGTDEFSTYLPIVLRRGAP